MRSKYKILILILVLLSVFGFMFVLNYNTSMVSDDYIYQFVFENRMPTSETRRLTNVFQLFPSMANHWRLWGGRVTVHFLLQFCFLMGKGFFNVFNSIMFIVLGLLIYKHIDDTKDINIPLLISIYAAIFLFVPQPGATILWKSGSANYLWASIMILIMTLIYKRHFDSNEKIKNTNLNAILIFLYGLFVGCSSENGVIALIITQILFMLAYKIKYNKIPNWAYAGLIGTIISYILLLASPGNYIRANEMYPGVEYKFDDLIDYTLKITSLTYKYVGIIIIAAFITTVLTINKQKDIKEYIKKYSIQIIFLIYTVISIYSLILSPAFPERSWMFTFVYLIIVLFYNINNIKTNNSNITSKKAIIITMGILSFLTIKEYYDANRELIESKKITDSHIEIINEEKSQGNYDIVVHTFPSAASKYNALKDNGYLTNNSTLWTNRWIAEYYGLNSIVSRS